MFELSRLMRRLGRLEREFNVKRAGALREFGPGSSQVAAVDAAHSRELSKLHVDIALHHSERLIREAFAFDVVLPKDDAGWLIHPNGRKALNFPGRSIVRKQIDEERVRRREVRAWWWKNAIIPALAAITGLVGVVTGLIAVIESRK